MSLEVEAQILFIVKKHPVGVRELSKIMRRRTQTIVSTIKRMTTAGLIEVQPEETHRKGRPRQIISATMLGDDYLQAFKKLKIKPLRSNRYDLAKAKRDAEYVNRLVARGREPYDAFLELNSLVRNRGDI
ncbi:MAG: MarR family transcriptional regulator [Candidatus Bathyarchaeota archaeon]|nr:MarR family transcriptional regulator [Candidatus Bathyarchaeota archaeon]